MRVGVLASGSGTNLQAILDRLHRPSGDSGTASPTAPSTTSPAPSTTSGAASPTTSGTASPPGAAAVEVVRVGASRPDALALERAAAAGVPTRVFPLDAYPDRPARDAAMAAWLAEAGVELVVLAGYMQLVTPGFLAAFPDRVINVHPALLPAFPGLRVIQQAVDYGVKVFGVTVHFVDEGVDSGRIISQRAIELPDATSATEVHAALQPLEHDLLCEAIAQFARGAVRFAPGHPRRVLVGG